MMLKFRFLFYSLWCLFLRINLLECCNGSGFNQLRKLFSQRNILAFLLLLSKDVNKYRKGIDLFVY